MLSADNSLDKESVLGQPKSIPISYWMALISEGFQRSSESQFSISQPVSVHPLQGALFEIY